MTQNLNTAQQKINVVDLSSKTYANILHTSNGVQLVWATDNLASHQT